MSTIQFFNGYTWESTPKAEVNRAIPIRVVVGRLADLRAEWQQAAESDGKTLLEIQANVGLLLCDICTLLELAPDETQFVMGPELREVVR